MWVIPANDLVVVVFSIAFENQVEAAIAKVFLQEIEISRRQSRDLATAPNVTYTQDPPQELKQLKDVDKGTGKDFIGFVSLGDSAPAARRARASGVRVLAPPGEPRGARWSRGA